jgi:hypothetical protein
MSGGCSLRNRWRLSVSRLGRQLYCRPVTVDQEVAVQLPP